MTLAEIAAVVGGRVEGEATTVVTAPAYVDSRVPVAGGLFVAVVGEHVDGHDFVSDAHAVLGSRATERPTVVVDDPVVALGRLARALIDRTHPRVLALTGSQGKTGTKDYLAQVLAGTGATVATRSNNNNELGVPLTVLRAEPETRHLVVEMGARGRGHISYLCDIAPPSIAAVLNVGTAHLGEFGSREAIAAAKGEIVEALPPTGTAVLNADDDLVGAMAGRTSAQVLTFGERADVRWRALTLDDLGRPSFELGSGTGWAPVHLTQSGVHQVRNAAAAAAMALAAGVDLESAADALTHAVATSPWRMELHERADGLLLINDAYNANPESVRAAIGTLAEIGARRRRRTIAVLGEMRELGAGSAAAHRSVGVAAAEAGLDLLVVVGPEAQAIDAGARSVAGWGGESILTAGRDEAALVVRENAGAEDVVLVKASRGVALEHLVDAVMNAATITGEGGAS